MLRYSHLLPVLMLLVLCARGTVGLLPEFIDCEETKCVSPSCECFKDGRLPKGCECFSDEKDSGYNNSWSTLPKSPSDLGVRFLVYTRENQDNHDIIMTKYSAIAQSNFKAGKPVKIIIHGFTSKAPTKFSLKMKKALLDYEDCNVVLVDWEKGAKFRLPQIYYVPVANVRIVGALLGRFIQDLKELNLINNYADVHLIGHSLGAHVSGMAGKEIYRLTQQKLGRISGLDPAGPLFGNGYGGFVRLGKDDAKFVDVIHTDGRKDLGFGIQFDVGDMDFWPNGGKYQPACREGFANKLKDEFDSKCDHGIATSYFTDSITACQYDFSQGCYMGYHASLGRCPGKVYDTLTTTESSPFCQRNSDSNSGPT